MQYNLLKVDPQDQEFNEIVGSWIFNPTEKRIKERIEKHLTEHRLYRVTDSGTLIGAFAVKDEGEGKIEITGLAVKQALRGRGYGRKINQWLIEEGFPAATIMVETDDSAVKFYTKCGFLLQDSLVLQNGIRRYRLEI